MPQHHHRDSPSSRVGCGPCVLNGQHGRGCGKFGTKRPAFPRRTSTTATPTELETVSHPGLRELSAKVSMSVRRGLVNGSALAETLRSLVLPTVLNRSSPRLGLAHAGTETLNPQT
jgi:hypothetical protein